MTAPALYLVRYVLYGTVRTIIETRPMIKNARFDVKKIVAFLGSETSNREKEVDYDETEE